MKKQDSLKKQGNLAQLKQKNGLFAKMLALQRESAEWKI